nr:hypothetical protein [Rhodococcus sp. (in: high G+C Gram-positive bacteria)]
MRCSELTESHTTHAVAFDDAASGEAVAGNLWKIVPSADGSTVVLYISRPSKRAGVDFDVTEHELSASDEIEMSATLSVPR